MMIDFFFPFAGFFSGSIPCSYLSGKVLGGKDVRREGSGNVGATNVFRVAGKKAGIAAAAGDVLKSLLPLIAARHLGLSPSWQAATGAAVILGHCYSPFLRFSGGKGILSFLTVCAVLSFPTALAFGIVWLGCFLTTGLVSLSSILGAAAVPVTAFLLPTEPAFRLLAFGASVFVIFKHRENIRRLRAGTESRMRSRTRGH